MLSHSVACGTNRSGTRVEDAKFRGRSRDALIRVYDEAGHLIETHEQAGDFKEW
jgi:hypothetical protein